jgi:hypothetical protein
LIRRYGESGAAVVEDDLAAGAPWPAVRGDFVERPSSAELRRYGRGGEGRWRSRPHFIRHDGRALARALLGLLEPAAAR